MGKKTPDYNLYISMYVHPILGKHEEGDEQTSLHSKKQPITCMPLKEIITYTHIPVTKQ